MYVEAPCGGSLKTLRAVGKNDATDANGRSVRSGNAKRSRTSAYGQVSSGPDSDALNKTDKDAPSFVLALLLLLQLAR